MAEGVVIARGTLRDYRRASGDDLTALPALDEAVLVDRLAGMDRPEGAAAFVAGAGDLVLAVGPVIWQAFCQRDDDGVLRALDGDHYLPPGGAVAEPELRAFAEAVAALAAALGARAWVEADLFWDPDDEPEPDDDAEWDEQLDEPPGVELTDDGERARWLAFVVSDGEVLLPVPSGPADGSADAERPDGDRPGAPGDEDEDEDDPRGPSTNPRRPSTAWLTADGDGARVRAGFVAQREAWVWPGPPRTARIPDVLHDGVAYEVKTGVVRGRGRAERQLAADRRLLADGLVEQVRWVFFPDSTGMFGPDPYLLDLLLAAQAADPRIGYEVRMS
ncbi:MAG TPA: hypothetical protein VGC67_12095 [Cellulomonas sp.]